MSHCHHTCWLKPWSGGDEAGLHVTDRPRRLLREFKSPHAESAALLVLIGNDSKQSAFRRLSFQTERIRGRLGGEVHLLASSFREALHKRIIVADTSIPHYPTCTSSLKDASCHETSSYTASIQCVNGERYSFDSIIHKALFPCADVICLFVDDFGGFKPVLEHLDSWLKMGPPSASAVRPRVLLVVKQEEQHQHQVDLQRFLQGRRRREADVCFNNFTVVGVPRAPNKRKRRRGIQTRRWQVLGSVIAKALESGRQCRRRSNSLFTVCHLAYFLQYATNRALHRPLESFNFIKISRIDRTVAPELSDHILEFLNNFRSLAALHRTGIPLIASSLLLDHYTPGMHLFDCHQVFNELYEAACLQASSRFKPNFRGLVSPFELVRLISCSMFTQFAQYQAIGSTLEWHRRQLVQNSHILSEMRSNHTCFGCIRRRPQFKLPCGHLICENCIRSFYTSGESDPWEYRPESCLVCGHCVRTVSIRLIPETSRLHVLSIDGGGIRGSAPIGFLKSMQDEIGIPHYNVQRSFDVKIGTSSGALSVVCLGILGWDVNDCMSYLKTFAEKSFVHRQSRSIRLLSSIPLVSGFLTLFQFTHALLSDSKYGADGIEQLLLDTYGCDRSVIDISGAAGTGGYVGVTLTKASDGSVFLATNHNSIDVQNLDSGYRHVELYDGENEVKWWEVLRCATAAPFYFKPKSLGNLGIFQDGGVAVNNPVCIAVQEAISMSPDMTEPSIVVSLGTGSAPDSDTEPSSILSNMFLSRLWRVFWRQTSPRTTWSHFLRHQKPGSKTQNFRFDVNFTGKEPLLDEVIGVDYVQQAARKAIARSPDLRRLCRQLRAELFLFELDEKNPPFFAHGAYQCSGRIICRLRAQTLEYEAFVRQLCARGASFRFGAQRLEVNYEDTKKDLCYEIKFAVPGPSSDIPITLNEATDEGYNIAGSPYTLDWLIRRQSLDENFGTSDHRSRRIPMIWIPNAEPVRH